ncbi:crotonobetainyl-CoA:carnitine CoA-transferase CaiB-like acyl-CoA transferase [Saccharothrix ecbatanensis]|uniref:Crotonobetainyl-CoA:carnitine CoA-transferase CaiB-like acyl-CoA transferase n=1 Tax=Saccharothrix ecbatanensis TaxID=1105145 RepID=A0A7W9HG70_9PSEU|nr:CoA transferase [Saccharothrix ecbatanensis]MBB5801600.1 crotonobetainyl-CoA:carnitine CoA-transferase CaiB-like acyl-CoA transferase [Saccharothrix ecbatanensis]
MDPVTAQAWTALGGRPDLTVEYRTAGNVLDARLPVRDLARATVGVCALAAAELSAQRNKTPIPPVTVDEGGVATAFVSERHLRIDGRTGATFAPLSRFWRTADGWVRTHANYPHHRTRLLEALGVADDALERELAGRQALEVQETVYNAGGLAVAVRTEVDQTRRALVETTRTDTTSRPLPPASRPAEGIRVLDLTRVFAGPVATRTLAFLGADVLRVDSPHLPEDPDAHTDTGMGKRSTLLDLAGRHDRRTFDDLLDQADVVVTGYRPGALDRHGFGTLHERRPDLVIAQLCAWGYTGEWADRRGFDSLVQAATGIAAVEGADGTPGVLPAQALDHGTGYLLAAAVLRALTERRGHHVRLSLAGTASWLLHDIEPSPAHGEYDPEPWLVETPSPYGTLRHARPPIARDGTWAHPSTLWGTDEPRWR